MVSSDNEEPAGENQESIVSPPVACENGVRDEIPHHIQTSQKELLDDKRHKKMLLNIAKAGPDKAWLTNFASRSMLYSPSVKFRQIAEAKDDISQSVPSTDQSSRNHFRVFRKINWNALKDMGAEWIRNPMNMALLVWIVCVAISGAILFMVMTGMLNAVLPSKSQRNSWFEVNNQILNALFTLMCLYQHPQRIHHLLLLCRWSPRDVLKLRKIYCKNGTYKPHEWMHMVIVVVLLNLNCFAQYALCGLNLGYPRSKRPPIGVGITITVAFGAAAAASVYNILSPLGRDYEIEVDPEAQNQITRADNSQSSILRLKTLERKYSFVLGEDSTVPESRLDWVGGLLDFWNDLSLAYLTLFCSCCVFGWNMDRLGFGNMYVHIATFGLFCIAPFFIFNLAAINIDNEVVRESLGLAGIVLCALGLLYGGFWRIQMRKRFNLPGNTFCCGNPSVTDFFQWLCCCSCSLAQEVRTADYYDILKDKFHMEGMSVDAEPPLLPLPREDGMPLFTSGSSSPYNGKFSPTLFKMETSPSPPSHPGGYSPHRPSSVAEEESSTMGNENTMKPPVVSVIQRGDTQ